MLPIFDQIVGNTTGPAFGAGGFPSHLCLDLSFFKFCLLRIQSQPTEGLKRALRSVSRRSLGLEVVGQLLQCSRRTTIALGKFYEIRWKLRTDRCYPCLGFSELHLSLGLCWLYALRVARQQFFDLYFKRL